MAREGIKNQAVSDEEDQAELNKAYEEMYGKSEESTEIPESIPNLEDDDVEETKDSDDDNTKEHEPDVLEDDQEDQGDSLDDELEETDHDAEELEPELETLDDEEEPAQKIKLSPDQQKVVDQRIQRELKKVKRAESETSELKAKVDLLTQLILGQGQPQGTNQQPQQPINFQAPIPQKPFEEMNEFEKIDYVVQYKQVEAKAQQEDQVQRQTQETQANAVKKVLGNLKQHLHDPIIKQIHDVDGTRYFSPQFTAALADYPNSASIMRHLYKNNKAELQTIIHQPSQTQIVAAVRYAERYNLERKQNFDKKVGAKKPTPPGKLKSAKLPKSDNGPKGVYDSDFLGNLSEDQYKKLIAKGY